MSSLAQIKPDILKKCLEARKYTVEDFACKISVNPEKLKSWLEGKEKPTYKQGKLIAKKLGISFVELITGLLPQYVPELPDLRTSPQKEPISENTLAVIRNAERKIEWLREKRLLEGWKPLNFVGAGSIAQKPYESAARIREILNLPYGWEFHSPDIYLREIVDTLELKGFIILRSSIVGNNTRRKLSLKEFRGFAFADRYAPLIFINTADEVKAQIFTLFHELAHVWIGQSGISDLEETENSKIEYWCNEVAAELLMPLVDFKERWKSQDIEELSRYYKASVYAILVRALRLGFIDKEIYLDMLNTYYATYKPKTKGGGGDIYINIMVRHSRAFTREVLYDVATGRLSYTRAAELLCTSWKTVDNMIQRFGFAS